MRIRDLLAALLVALACFGCQKKPPIIGDWAGTMKVQGISSNATLHFAEAGDFKIVLPLKRPDGKGVDCTLDGTWKMSGDDLSMNVTSVDMKPVGLTAQEAQLLAGIMEAQKAKVLADANKQPLTHLKWTDNDTVTIDNGSNPQEIRRVKGSS